MNPKLCARKLFILFLISVPLISKSQYHTSKTTEFYVGYMENLDLAFNGPPTFSLVVGATEATNGTISIPSTGYTQDFNVGASTATEIFLPAAIYYPEGDEDISNQGIKVVTDHPVSLYAFHNRLYFSEATLILPTNELGDNYIVAAHADDGPQGGLSELVVEGTTNNTDIEITPSVLTLGLRPPGVPFTITLNEGQLFQLQSYGDLTGTRVKSLIPDKKIAVFSGAQWADIDTNCAATSHVYDEDYPVSTWGTEYILVPFSGQGGDPFRIIASADQTSVYFDGLLKATLNTGQYYDQTVFSATYVTASNPVSAIQFDKGGACNASLMGDPSMLILSPLSLTETNALFRSVNTFDTPDHFVNIVCTKGGFSSMKVDNTNISADFSYVNGNVNYAFAQISLAEGSHILENSSGFSATCYGFGDFNAYTFNSGFGDPTYIGIDDPADQIPSLDISPNPMKDEARISFNKIPNTANDVYLEIYSVEGKLLLSEQVHEPVYHLVRNDLLKPGIYFCRLSSGKQVIAMEKLVVE